MVEGKQDRHTKDFSPISLRVLWALPYGISAVSFAKLRSELGNWPSWSSDYSCNLSHIGEKCTALDQTRNIIREESVEKDSIRGFFLF